MSAVEATDGATALAMGDGELFAAADARCRAVFGDGVFLRGLIEASNRCVRDCLYCGIRRSNGKVRRYGLDDVTILSAVAEGYRRGLRSFVIQGAEDPAFTPRRLATLASSIKSLTEGEAALTYSFGTMGRLAYGELRAGGADRYLLRFETANPDLHKALRGTPLAGRLKALDDLRALGFELGSGFMTGLPSPEELNGAPLGSGQLQVFEAGLLWSAADEDRLAGDVSLAAALGLDMVGVGPFIPHPDTPLAGFPCKGLRPALRATAALRLSLPAANIPATTAAGSVAPDGRERMLAAGANVLMPNVGPVESKKDYELYPGKICLDEDGFRCLGCLSGRVGSVGKRLSYLRGDSPGRAAV